MFFGYANNINVGDVFISKFRPTAGEVAYIITIVNINKPIFGYSYEIKSIGGYYFYEKYHKTLISQKKLFKFFNFSERLTNEYAIKNIIQ